MFAYFVFLTRIIFSFFLSPCMVYFSPGLHPLMSGLWNIDCRLCILYSPALIAGCVCSTGPMNEHIFFPPGFYNENIFYLFPVLVLSFIARTQSHALCSILSQVFFINIGVSMHIIIVELSKGSDRPWSHNQKGALLGPLFEFHKLQF